MLPDLFLSYATCRLADAAVIEKALRDRELRLWRDTESIADLDDIPNRIREGLARCQALLLLWDPEYLGRRACSAELLHAWRLGVGEGDALARVLVLIPADTDPTAVPAFLARRRWIRLPSPGDAAAWDAVVLRIRERVSGLSPMGTPPEKVPRWLPNRRLPSPRFVGREHELWALHAALSPAPPELGGPASGHGHAALAIVRGLGGMGKSLLAVEYAHRFGAAWPGGIFWLRGTDQLLLQVGQVLMGLGEAAPDSIEEARAVLARRLAGKPALWVLDDWPEGENTDALTPWLHPTGGATLLTTRDRRLSALGTALDLLPLPDPEALHLLTGERPPSDPAEAQAASAVAASLGQHPLALDIARAAARVEGRRPWASLVARLAEVDEDALESFSVEVSEELPLRYARSVAATLLLSIGRLEEAGRDVLRIASVIAEAPFPVELVTATLETAYGLDPKDASARARSGIGQVDAGSLAERVALVEGEQDLSGRQVHALVSRTVRFHDRHVLRRLVLRDAAVGRLAAALGPPDDPPPAAEILPLLPHCRVLAKDASTLLDCDLAAALAHADLRLGNARVAAYGWGQVTGLLVELRGPADPSTLLARGNLAEALRAIGDLAAAHAEALASWQGRRQHMGAEDPFTLGALNNLAMLELDLGQLDAAEEHARQALEARNAVLGDQHRDTLRSANNLAEVWRARGRSNDATTLHEQVLEARRQRLGSQHADTWESLQNLAATRGEAGEAGDALPIMDELIAVLDVAFGPEHPRVLLARNNRARLLLDLGQHKEALDELEALPGPLIERLGRLSPDLLRVRQNLFQARLLTGDLDGAAREMDTLLPDRLAIYEPEHPEVARALAERGGLRFVQGNAHAALADFEQAANRLRAVLDPDHLDLLAIDDNRIEALLALGRQSEAETLMVELLQRFARQPEHPRVLFNRYRLGSLLLTLRRFDEAAPLLEGVLDTLQRTRPSEDQETWAVASEAALAQDRSGAHGRARQTLEGLLAAQQDALGPHDLAVLTTRNNLAGACRRAGDARAAETHWRAVLAQRSNAIRATATSITAWNLCCLLWEEDREAEALPVENTYLSWLTEADPEGLAPEQRELRERLSRR